MLGAPCLFGGSVADRTYGLAVDSVANLHWSGLTQLPNFPTRNAAQQWPQWPGPGAPRNAFVTRFGPS